MLNIPGDITFAVGTNVVANVITAVIFFAAGVCARIAIARLLFLSTRWFWNPRSDKSVIIYLGGRSEFMPDEGSGNPMVHFADAAAASELQDVLRRHYDEVLVQVAPATFDPDKPFVSLGGTISNVVTKELELALPYKFSTGSSEATGGRSIVSEKRTEVYSPVRAAAVVTLDVAYIARLDNQRRTPPRFVFAGTYGYGTLAATRYAISPLNLLKLRCRLLLECVSSNFQLVLTVPVVNDEPRRAQLAAGPKSA